MVKYEKLVRAYTQGKSLPTPRTLSGEPSGEQQRSQASKLQIQAVLSGKSPSRKEDAVHQAPSSEPLTRFGATTASRSRAESLPDAVKQLTELTTDHPIIQATSPKPLPKRFTKGKKKSKPGSVSGNPQNGNPDRRSSQWEKQKKKELTTQYVELNFKKAFRDLFGVEALTIAIALNPRSAPNILSQSETFGIYNPESSDSNAHAALLADLLAFLGLWNYWLEGVSEGSIDQLIEASDVTADQLHNLPAPQTVESKLATFCILAGPALIEILIEETNTIDQQRRYLLNLISNRSPMHGVNNQAAINSQKS
jgi:hypothetical protein